MPIKTNILAWWSTAIAGWRCAQCDERLGDGVLHDCPVDRVARQPEVSPLIETRRTA